MSYCNSVYWCPCQCELVSLYCPWHSVLLTSGEVTKAWVAGLASFLAVKFLLKDVTIVFFSPFFTSFLRTNKTQSTLEWCLSFNLHLSEEFSIWFSDFTRFFFYHLLPVWEQYYLPPMNIHSTFNVSFYELVLVLDKRKKWSESSARQKVIKVVIIWGIIFCSKVLHEQSNQLPWPCCY